MNIMKQPFRLGVSPDFYTEAKESLDSVVSAKLTGLAGFEVAPMPPAADLLATPEALDQFDAIFALALLVTRDSVKGVTAAKAPSAKPTRVVCAGRTFRHQLDELFRPPDFSGSH